MRLKSRAQPPRGEAWSAGEPVTRLITMGQVVRLGGNGENNKESEETSTTARRSSRTDGRGALAAFSTLLRGSRMVRGGQRGEREGGGRGKGAEEGTRTVLFLFQGPDQAGWRESVCGTWHETTNDDEE